MSRPTLVEQIEELLARQVRGIPESKSEDIARAIAYKAQEFYTDRLSDYLYDACEEFEREHINVIDAKPDSYPGGFREGLAAAALKVKQWQWDF